MRAITFLIHFPLLSVQHKGGVAEGDHRDNSQRCVRLSAFKDTLLYVTAFVVSQDIISL